MNSDTTLPFLGLMKKAGKLELGEESVRSAAERGKAWLIISASDAAPRSVRAAKGIASTWELFHIELPYTKDEIGAVTGRGTPGMMAVTDAGFAAKLCSKLATEEPEKYAETAETLEQFAGKKSGKSGTCKRRSNI